MGSLYGDSANVALARGAETTAFFVLVGVSHSTEPLASVVVTKPLASSNSAAKRLGSMFKIRYIERR